MLNLCSSLPRPTAEPYIAMTLFVFSTNSLVLPMMVEHRVCLNNYNSTICQHLGSNGLKTVQNDIQQEAARWLAFLPLSALIPSFFVVLIMGPLSDVIGKKKLMILPPLIYFIQSCIFITLCSIKSSFTPAVYFIPYCLTGAFGDFAGVTLLCAAYMADLTKSEERTLRFMIMESASLTSAISAAGITGLTLSYFGYIGTFSVNAVVCVINLVYTVFVLPQEESIKQLDQYETTENIVDIDYSTKMQLTENTVLLHSECSTKTSLFAFIRTASNLQSCFKKIKNTFCTNGIGKPIACLLTLLLLTIFTNAGEVYIGILFMKHAPFNLSPLEISYLSMVSYVLRAIGVVTVPYICVRAFKLKDTSIVIVGFISQILYFSTFAFAVNTRMLFAVQVMSLALMVSSPTIRVMLSKLVGSGQHGTVVAAGAAIDVLSAIASSSLSNIIYSATVKIFTGISFLVLAFVALIGLIGAIIFRFNFEYFNNSALDGDGKEEEYTLINEGIDMSIQV